MSDEKCVDLDKDENKNFVAIYFGGRNNKKQRHGQGWAILPNGDQYDGDYREGQRHGEGLYVFQNGARYLGQYRYGKKSGKGQFFYPDGSIYDGYWKKNVRHGLGEYTYANGDVYNGNWYKGLRHGLGCYIFKNNVFFRGTWNQGVPVGPMELHFENYKYHGSFDYQYPQGPGIYSFMCKYMLSGYYKSETVNLPKEEEVIEENDDENLSEENQANKQPKLLKNLIPPPLWYSQHISKYDFSKLPQQPIPLPLSDSEFSSCDLSFDKSKESKFSKEESRELEECEIECEQSTSKSTISIDLCSTNYNS